MGELERVLDVVHGLHAASTAPERLGEALAGVWQLVGGVGSTFELMDRKSLGHSFFAQNGRPEHDTDLAAYLEHYAAINPRAQDALRQPAGAVRWDQQFIDESEMDWQPFYAEHLKPARLRYHFYGVLQTAPENLGVLTVQLTEKRSDAGKREARLLKALLPHAGQALDVAMRLRRAQAGHDLAEAVDWLADGLVLLGAGGRVLSANQAARALARRRDGFALSRGEVVFADGRAQGRLRQALAGIAGLAAGSVAAIPGDFTARRPGAAAPYAVSVRPLNGAQTPGAVVMLLIHDPLRHGPGKALLQEAFGLTGAEAQLAAALAAGQSPDGYAAVAGVSRNTVYSHLAHLKDKCGAPRLVELVRLLNQVATAAAGREE